MIRIKEILKKVFPILSLVVLSASSLVIANYAIKINQENRSQAASKELSGNRFVWIRKHVPEGFSEEEMRYVAQNYDVLVIGYTHAMFDRNVQHAQVRHVKELNPKVTNFLYWRAAERNLEDGWGDFPERWYLHTLAGSRVRRPPASFALDLTNADYRAWLEETILSEIEKAPYDGVFWDEANQLDVPWTVDPIGQPKADAWNKAYTDFLQRMANILEKRGYLSMHNGIRWSNDGKWKFDGESLNRLSNSNGVLNETFCYGADASWKAVSIPKEVQIQAINEQVKIGNSGKYVFQKVNLDTLSKLGPVKRAQAGRFCYAVFLMGHVPGKTFFKFGEGYEMNAFPNEYQNNAKEVNLPLAEPVNDYQRPGGGWLLQRRFDKGWVIVNLDETDNTWTAPQDLELWNDGQFQRKIKKDQAFTVGAQDAAFFLKVGSDPSPNPDKKVGDINKDGKVNVLDYTVLFENFGKNPIPNKKADINKDDKVDILDYSLLFENFGK